MNAAHQEAESFKYSNRMILVLPLTDGRFALFNNARELHAIVARVDDTILRSMPPMPEPVGRQVAPTPQSYLTEGTF